MPAQNSGDCGGLGGKRCRCPDQTAYVCRLRADFSLSEQSDTAATAGEAAGEVLEAGGEAAGKGFEGLMKGLGISMDTVKYVGIGIVVIFIIFVILKLMAKKKSG